jgi:polyhydroxyalkanoate synthesis repressor PhaR
MAYVIKRYSNRKLYDPQASRYVTLEELAAMIRTGREISVVDVATGEDLTSVVLAQIILEKEKQHDSALPTGFMHQLIQYGEAWQDFALSSMKGHLEGLMTSQREADQALKRWATQCGWLSPSHPEAAAEKSEEIETLKREIAGLRDQLEALSSRLDEQQRS